MSWLESLGLFARAPDLREPAAIEADIAEELEFHLSERARAFEHEGHAPKAARALAEQSFGPRAPIERQCRRIQMGERIMLQRINLVLVLVLLAALVSLGWRFSASQRELRAAVDSLSQALVKQPASASTMTTPPSESTVDKIQREWHERAQALGDAAADLGEQIAVLDIDVAMEVVLDIYSLIHAPAARRKLLEPFVRGAGHVYAIAILDTAARDPDLELRTWALRQVESYALRDFVAEPLAYPEWREAVQGRPLREILSESAQAFRTRVTTSRGNDLLREVALFERLRFEPAGARGIDLRDEISGHIEGDSLVGHMMQRQAFGGAYDDSIKPKIQDFLVHLGAGAYDAFDVKPK